MWVQGKELVPAHSSKRHSLEDGSWRGGQAFRSKDELQWESCQPQEHDGRLQEEKTLQFLRIKQISESYWVWGGGKEGFRSHGLAWAMCRVTWRQVLSRAINFILQTTAHVYSTVSFTVSSAPEKELHKVRSGLISERKAARASITRKLK